VRGASKPGVIVLRGLVALGAIILAWYFLDLPPLLVLAASIATFFYFLWWSPTTCGAENRTEGTFCRNNATGLLGTCHLRAHADQKLKLRYLARGQLTRRWFAELRRRILRDSRKAVAAAGASATALLAIIALVGVVAGGAVALSRPTAGRG